MTVTKKKKKMMTQFLIEMVLIFVIQKTQISL